MDTLDCNQMIYSIDQLKEMRFSYYTINKLVENNNLKKLNRKNYENLDYNGDFNEYVYVNAFITRGVICLNSAAAYYGLTNTICQSIDVAIYRKENIHTIPDWPSINFYYYSDKRYKAGIKKIYIWKNLQLLGE